MKSKKLTSYSEFLADRLAGGWGDQAPDAALSSMANRGLSVSADEADQILGLTPGTTLFFNHAGFVPAEAIMAEQERQAVEARDW